MNQTKQWYTSKTIWGVIISAGGKIVGMATGYEMSEDDTSQLVDLIIPMASFGVSFVGDILAWYGRVKAKKEIGVSTVDGDAKA